MSRKCMRSARGATASTSRTSRAGSSPSFRPMTCTGQAATPSSTLRIRKRWRRRTLRGSRACSPTNTLPFPLPLAGEGRVRAILVRRCTPTPLSRAAARPLPQAGEAKASRARRYTLQAAGECSMRMPIIRIALCALLSGCADAPEKSATAPTPAAQAPTPPPSAPNCFALDRASNTVAS